MYFMEIFVGMVQAFVFVILSTIFINMATSHGH
jgi:F0F1-type ATP synthase membrane subunit a